jgi:hypothetical protein
MRLTAVTLTAALLLGAGVADAKTEYSASIRGCEAAIAERLGAGAGDLNMRVKGVDSASRHRDLDFAVSSRDATSAIQGVRATCRARKNGEVMALTFDERTLPAALAQH